MILVGKHYNHMTNAWVTERLRVLCVLVLGGHASGSCLELSTVVSERPGEKGEYIV